MLKSIKIGRGTDNEVPEWKIRARWSSFMFILYQRNIRLLLNGHFEQFTLASIKHCTMNNSTFLWIDIFYAVEYR